MWRQAARGAEQRGRRRCAAAAERQPLAGSVGGWLAVGDAGTKGLGIFAERAAEPGQELLRSSPATAAPRLPRAAAPAAGAAAAYVLDAPVPTGRLGEDEAAMVKRFPFLGDPRLWAAVAAPRQVPLAAGIFVDLEQLHHAIAAPLFATVPGEGRQAFHEHALLNHSCCPEVVRYFEGGALVLRASRPIQLGSEVSDSYFFPLVPLHLRVEACHAFGFQCCCPRCASEAALPQRTQVWAKLTWENSIRILGEVAAVRAAARGDASALRGSERAAAGAQQLAGLVESTEQRLRALDLSEADLQLCLASWVCPAAAAGDLAAAARGDFAAAAEALDRASRWAEPVSPGHALGLLARAAGYALGAGGAVSAEVAGRFEALRRRCFGGDVPAARLLPPPLLSSMGHGGAE